MDKKKAILDVALTVRSGGLRVLIQALIDGQQGISQVLVQSVLYVLDTPDTRCYLRPGVELETIIAPFTESNKGANYEERLKNSAKMVTTLIKSWAGLFYMSANNMRAARSVVQALRMPVPETQVSAVRVVMIIVAESAKTHKTTTEIGVGHVF